MCSTSLPVRLLSEQSISNACGPQLWSPDHERHICIRWVYFGVTWITIVAYSYNISIAILAHASASAKAWWWLFESYPQQAAMMSRLWYPPGQRSALKKLESLILLFPLYKNIIFHSMFFRAKHIIETTKKRMKIWSATSNFNWKSEVALQKITRFYYIELWLQYLIPEIIWQGDVLHGGYLGEKGSYLVGG